ncbi:MAG TPA: LuxR C-terminal-related transcriptional regulator, partial [Thermoanaerobaculia bacterium]
FRGMAAVLEESGEVRVIGERNFARILTLEQLPDDLNPRVCLLAHRLIIEYGLATIPHITDLFSGIGVLVHGEHGSLEVAAEVLAVGAKGFFDLSEPIGYLPTAVKLASRGKMWGPREAVAMMAQRVVERSSTEQKAGDGRSLSEDDLLLLRYLHDGLSNKEMASRLHVAEVTIKTRMGRLYRKFGVNTRVQLLAAALRERYVI